MRERPSYYAVIPADVRYDKELSANAKLLYGEITALCNKRGYCWAGNKYFADLYDTTESSVKRWIKNLSDAGYIVVSYNYVEGKKEIQSRIIEISNAEQRGGCKNEPTSPPDGGDGDVKNAENEAKDAENEAKDEMPAVEKDGTAVEAAGGGCKNDPTWGQKCTHVGSFLNGGGCKNALDNITSIITKFNKFEESTSTPADIKKTADAAVVVEDPLYTDLEMAFSMIDPLLVFDRNFYHAALSTLQKYNLDNAYLKWLYEFCKKKEPRDLTGYFFTVFHEENLIRRFIASRQPAVKTAAARTAVCPVCGANHSEYSQCPSCGFSGDPNDPKQVEPAKVIFNMPQDIRASYEKDRGLAFEPALSLASRFAMLKAVNLKYGIEKQVFDG
jgi:hypothetical protein